MIVKVVSWETNADTGILVDETVTLFSEFHWTGLQVPCAISFV